ncbi:MAG TPA: ABC transporter ATP-binding protein [Gemmataceae bacterium]|jgi:ABC-2 type transport system ATP-binding protein|nr:ABC transporter ATP-binding protein [Gemmataceae bacterium]
MIEVHYLRKEYGETVALQNLHLEIPEGEVYGLIGPNGAGKTTLIRILATLLEPTYGRVRVAGIDVLEEPLRVHPLIGYMSDFFSLYDNMLVWEYLDHFARCYGIHARVRERMVEEVLKLVSLDVRRDAEVKALSRGMRQRLCFAKTLLHEPRVLLLDEPASGLDPAGRLEFRELIKQLHAMGRTILISSHILTEMADFCTSAGIMEQGQLLVSGRIEDILRQLEPDLQIDIEVASGMDQLMVILKEHGAVRQLDALDHRVRCRWRGSKEALPELHRRIVAGQVGLVSFAVKTDNLEDIYMKISRHQTS